MSKFSQPYQVVHNGIQLLISGGHLKEFSETYVSCKELRSRCSELFLLDLYVHAYASGINPESVLCELRAMENNDLVSKTKPATQFRKLPLKGLWHKHFYIPQFMPQNRLNAHRGGKIESEIKRVFNEFDESKFESKLEAYKSLSLKIALASEKLGKNREDASLLTGEWIVFAKHEEKNYYFCIEPHNTDEKIYTKVIKSCAMDFPNLTEVIENYA